MGGQRVQGRDEEGETAQEHGYFTPQLINLLNSS